MVIVYGKFFSASWICIMSANKFSPSVPTVLLVRCFLPTFFAVMVNEHSCDIQQISYFSEHFVVPTWHFVFGKALYWVEEGGCQGQPGGVAHGVMWWHRPVAPN
jgi:hypothetical protein